MIITTERLHYLWAVAETGSFAAAGRRLGVSGAAVQQVIRHFEQDLDAPLFRRSPGRSPVLRACLETHLSIMKRFNSMLAMAI